MSRPPSPRMRRVNAMVREVVAEEVENLKDPRLGFVTVTGVDTAPDLRTAVVYYSVLGSPEEVASSAAALEAARSRINRVLGRRVRLKYTPRLTFRVDESIERGSRLGEIFRRLHEGETYE